VYEYVVIEKFISEGLKFWWFQSPINIGAGQHNFSGSKLPPLPRSDGVWTALYHREALDFGEISISGRVKRRRGKGIRRLALTTSEIEVLKMISWSC
jgi:hypothetical protein